jgi:hypothetical protein
MYGNQFTDAPAALTQFLREFGTELIVGFKRDDEEDEKSPGVGSA